MAAHGFSEGLLMFVIPVRASLPTLGLPLRWMELRSKLLSAGEMPFAANIKACSGIFRVTARAPLFAFVSLSHNPHPGAQPGHGS